MPSFPSELSEWLAPSVFLAVPGLLLGIQGKQIGELRDDMKELQPHLKTGETRQREDNRVLSEKLDRLVEALLTAKQSRNPFMEQEGS